MKFAQDVQIQDDGSMIISNDWYPGCLPANMIVDDYVYLDTSYSFTSFNSTVKNALQLGYATGNYGRSNIITGLNGHIKIGKYVILEATNIICNQSIIIGHHCMFSWGSVITDSWLDINSLSLDVRRSMLIALSSTSNRHLEFLIPQPVVIEDNVWVGFDAVILPGVRLGKGCIVGCKTIITADVPPYAIVVGSPAKIVKYLDPED